MSKSGPILATRVYDLEYQLKDLQTQVTFWKTAAEQACDMLNKLEDEHELLKDTLRALVRDERPE